MPLAPAFAIAVTRGRRTGGVCRGADELQGDRGESVRDDAQLKKRWNAWAESGVVTPSPFVLDLVIGPPESSSSSQCGLIAVP